MRLKGSRRLQIQSQAEMEAFLWLVRKSGKWLLFLVELSRKVTVCLHVHVDQEKRSDAGQNNNISVLYSVIARQQGS